MSAVGDARKRAEESLADTLEDIAEDLEEVLVDYDVRGDLFGTSGAGAQFLAQHIVASNWFKRVTG